MAKLLYLSASTFPSRAANTLQIVQMCDAFLGAGHKAILTGVRALGQGDLNWPNALKPALLRWPYRPLRMRLLKRQSRSLIRRERPDLVITRVPILAALAAATPCPTILELHTLPAAGSKSSAALGAVLRMPNLVRVVTISETLARDLATEYRVDDLAGTLTVAHDAAAAGPDPVPPPGSAPLKVGYFGHLYAGKGMETIAQLAPQLPDLQFEIYGGREADIAHWRRELSRVENLTLHGHIPHSEVRAKQERCDILIAPYSARANDVSGRDISRWMSPLKLFEYMAAGRAIVTSDLEVLREVVQDGREALLCKPNDLESWLGAFTRLREDADLRLRLGVAARRLLLARYTWEQRAELLLKGLV